MRSKAVALAAVLAAAVVACDSGTAPPVSGPGAAETAEAPPPTTEAPAPPSTVSTSPADGGEAEDSETTSGGRGETTLDFEVAHRISSDNGDIVHIVLPEGGYTDVDLERFIGDLIESLPGLWGAEIFAGEDGAAAFAVPEGQRTEEQKQALAKHHFASLIDGDTVRFQGPFAELGEYVLSS